jgi:hypothetical protein
VVLSSERIGPTAHYTERMGSLSDRHRVHEVDALREDDGPGSIAALAAELDPGQGSRLANILEASITLPSEASTA